MENNNNVISGYSYNSSTEMDKIKEALKSIGYEEVSTFYCAGIITSRYMKEDVGIHLEFGIIFDVFGEDEILGVQE